MVFLFGEIDCREGLLKATMKGIYSSIEEASNHIINLYIKVLQKYKKEKQLEIFVHPIPPVLDPTRSTVIIFNDLLKNAIQKTDLHYLDFFDDLLEDSAKEEAAKKLNPIYGLDGTHLSPVYLPLLERALNKY